MRIEQTTMLDLLSKKDAIFSIPLFQRPYSWNLAQCETLWQDLAQAAKSGSEHFIGLILYKRFAIAGAHTGKKDSGGRCDPIQEFCIIDGQQRILTMFLLVSAFAQYTGETQNEADAGTDTEAISGLLKAPLTGAMLSGFPSSQAVEWKVIPTKRDRLTYLDALERAFSEDEAAELVSSASNARQARAATNKAFFLEKMREGGMDVRDIHNVLCKLTVITVELGPDDNAQAIFESFNSRGVSLVTADLIRNYLLMAEDSQTQKRLYEEYWDPIQGQFGDDPGSLKLNGALRAWITIRCKEARAMSDRETFDVFKHYCENEYDGPSEAILDEILGFCHIWAENYRYHAVKKYRSMNWSKLGRKTLVSDTEKVKVDKDTWNFYAKHYGIGEYQE